MKRIFFTAVVAFFVTTAFAQTTTRDQHGKTVSTVAKGTTLEGSEKGKIVSATAKGKSHSVFSSDDLNHDGRVTAQEREVARAREVARRQARKDDLNDDGKINGSTNNSKGNGAKSKAKTGKKVKASTNGN